MTYSDKTPLRDSIILKPHGGLGNRLRTINSAFSASKLMKKRLIVIWESSRELKCPFYKLFKIPRTFRVINLDRGAWLEAKGNILDKADKVIDDKKIAWFGLSLSYDYFVKELSRCGLIFIESCFNFYPYPDFSSFKPIKKIASAIETYKRRFDDNTIGVHIRRNDHVRSVRYSRTEDFIEAMRYEIEDNGRIKFFLATDSPAEAVRIKKIFGHKRIMARPKDLKRNTVRGAQDALIDMMCLAGTTKILGSFRSSFCDVAAEIGKIKKVDVGETY